MKWLDNKRSVNPWSQGQQPAWVLLSLLLVAAVGIAAYSNTFSVPFTFDDEQAIATNNITKEISRIFTGQGLHYNNRRVFGYLSLALNYRFGGLDVTGYHIVNLTIHIASAFLVYALAVVTLKTPFFTATAPSAERMPLPPGSSLLPLVGSLLFVVHPIQTQAVTYIVQRFASLATLLYLAAVVCYAHGRLTSATAALTPLVEPRHGVSSEGWRRRGVISLWFLLAGLMSALAMGTKEIAATLPAAILLYEFSFFGFTRKKLVRIFWIALTFAGVCGVYLLSAHRATDFFATINSMTRETDSISRMTYFLTEITVVVHYLSLLVLPVNQQVVYDYPLHHSLFDVDVILSSLLLGSLLALSGWLYFFSGRSARTADKMQAPWVPTLAGRQLLRITAFGGIWFFLTLSIESSFIPIRDVIFEHRLYLPSAGFFLAVSAAAVSILTARRTRIFSAMAGVVVVTLASFTYLRNEIWRDPVRLWRENADKATSNVGAWQNLGVALNRKGDYRGAIQAYRYCLLLDKVNPDIYNNLGAANASMGLIDEAAAMYRKSLLLAPEQWFTWLNVGSLDIKKGDYPAAENDIKMAIRYSPGRMEVHYHLGYLYELQGRNGEAEKNYREAITLDPSYALAWKGLGNVCRAQGRAEEAIGYINRGNVLERDGGDIYYGISSQPGK